MGRSGGLIGFEGASLLGVLQFSFPFLLTKMTGRAAFLGVNIRYTFTTHSRVMFTSHRRMDVYHPEKPVTVGIFSLKHKKSKLYF
jgi:hypothetical protein